jgi:iron(II)-dependent oxidoreductase
MSSKHRAAVLWITGVASLANLTVGWCLDNSLMLTLGAAGICYFGLRTSGWGPRRPVAVQSSTTGSLSTSSGGKDASSSEPAAPVASGDLVEQMLADGRYALLLRPQIIANLTPEQRDEARAAFEDGMAIVPEGEVLVGSNTDPHSISEFDQEDLATRGGTILQVDSFYLDRYPVTNRQYQAFVTGGGYEQMAIWEKNIWAAILDFVDSTGCPGPRFWKNGKYPDGQGDMPVVGVSWYEASAYARWVGKRLPSDPEWEKAGSWPVHLANGVLSQRKFPWGDTMDRTRANIWGSGWRSLVPVHEFSTGGSVGGVQQLIGNVWEWTTGDFGRGPYPDRRLTLPMPMKSVRGGAFDTYFDNQATCQFRSGENPVARKHNIGFRCGLSLCDLADASAELNEATEDTGTDAAEPLEEACV